MGHHIRCTVRLLPRDTPGFHGGAAMLALLLFLTGLIPPALAMPIPVDNPSFEQLPPSGLNYGCGSGCSYSVEQIPGWQNIPFLGLGLESGQFRPGMDAGNFTYFDSMSDGPTSAHTTTGCIWQVLPVTVQAGVTYTLQADVGWRKDAGPVGLVRLVVNGVFYDGAGTAVFGGWAPHTATYVARAEDVGQPITICLSSVTNQGNFDNVRMFDSTTASGVGDSVEPAAFELAVQPNPFRAAATVRWSLAAPASVALRVFDVSGRAVRTLLTGADQDPGAHESAWDGTDDAGSPVNSGLYFLRLDAGAGSRVVRVLRVQ